jgi:Zn-dependent M28 family amino/carboxypeptidase
MFLWLSGEEIGIFGSQSYAINPIFPLDKTVAVLNIDMIGRIKNEADTLKDRPVSGPNEVFVITDDQSKELVALADAVAKKNNLKLDYSLSGKNHPQMLFARSDHFNFVKKDIPVLFFHTGEHADYHKTGDVPEKINFKNMELITRTIFEIGYQVANKKTRIVVDNPFSKWEDNPFKNF